jgi:hypothetical protein
MKDCSTKVMCPCSKWKGEKDWAELELHCNKTKNSLHKIEQYDVITNTLEKNRYIFQKEKATFISPSSKMKPIIIGTAVKTPIWTRNWAFKAASSAVFPRNLAWRDIE